MKVCANPISGHVLYPMFGKDKDGRDIDYYEHLSKLVSQYPKGLEGYKAAIAIREHYEYMHGIVVDDTPSNPRPLALVAMNIRDGGRHMWMRYKRMEEHRIYSIEERHGIKLMDFLHLPTADIEWMINMAAFDIDRKRQLAKQQEEEDARKRGHAP